MLTLLLLVACTAGKPATDGEDSGPTDTGEDGDSPSPLGDAVVAPPPCTLGATDGRLDPEGGCADGICLGDTLREADEAFGSPGFCTTLTAGDATCFWGDVVIASFRDEDGDGQPDDGARAWVVQVLDPWNGGTPEGLALAISTACWVEGLGPADQVTLTAMEDGYHATALTWDTWYLTVTDRQDANLDFVPDGYVESVAFTNPIYAP